MNKYIGNTGQFTHIPEPNIGADSVGPIPQNIGGFEIPNFIGDENKTSNKGILSGLGGLLSKVDKSKFETNDLILYAILYLMYRESGDFEFLLILGAMLFM